MYNIQVFIERCFLLRNDRYGVLSIKLSKLCSCLVDKENSESTTSENLFFKMIAVTFISDLHHFLGAPDGINFVGREGGLNSSMDT